MGKKIFEEKTDKEYQRIAPDLRIYLPFADLVRGIPKHMDNFKKYYKSTIDDMSWSMIYGYLLSLGFLSLCLKNFYLDAAIPLIFSVFISQIKNYRRMKYFKDETYNCVCKKYFFIILGEAILMFTITIALYLKYIGVL